MLLLIYDAPEAIQYARAILDFTILAQYILHDNKMLHYIKHTLYKLEKTKIAFEDHRPIDSKLYWPTFNYPKFHAISHFVYCIRDYSSALNYDTAHNKAVHKYLLKAFYNKTNQKEYDLQIRQHNVRHSNIITIKDVINKKKVQEKERLLKDIADITALAEMAWALSLIDFVGKYMWAMSNANLDAVKKLELTSIKKYWRQAW